MDLIRYCGPRPNWIVCHETILALLVLMNFLFYQPKNNFKKKKKKFVVGKDRVYFDQKYDNYSDHSRNHRRLHRQIDSFKKQEFLGAQCATHPNHN